jgi:hypothetical protein
MALADNISQTQDHVICQECVQIPEGLKEIPIDRKRRKVLLEFDSLLLERIESTNAAIKEVIFVNLKI